MAAQSAISPSNGRTRDLDTLYLLGGAALILVGAGLILANSKVRKYASEMNVVDLAKDIWPDLDRYLRLRLM